MIRASVCVDPSLAGSARQRVVARRLLRRDLALAFGLPDTEPVLVPNSFGKPLLAAYPGIHVSISHCRGAVVVAASDRRIGVDVEWIRPHNRYAAARMLRPVELSMVLSAQEPDRQFFRYWTLKESYVKALGVGLAYPVRRLAVSVATDGSAAVDRPGASAHLDERFPGYVLACCCLRAGTEDAEPAAERVALEAVGWS